MVAVPAVSAPVSPSILSKAKSLLFETDSMAEAELKEPPADDHKVVQVVQRKRGDVSTAKRGKTLRLRRKKGKGRTTANLSGRVGGKTEAVRKNWKVRGSHSDQQQVTVTLRQVDGRGRRRKAGRRGWRDSGGSALRMRGSGSKTKVDV